MFSSAEEGEDEGRGGCMTTLEGGGRKKQARYMFKQAVDAGGSVKLHGISGKPDDDMEAHGAFVSKGAFLSCHPLVRLATRLGW